MDLARWLDVRLRLRGTLQGVGFRPSMARLAAERGLGGSVSNEAGTVLLAWSGEREAVERVLAELPQLLPVAARLDGLEVLERRALSEAPPATFVIAASVAEGIARVSIPADLAMCADCRAEVRDPTSRFHGYPFTTCTNCGPRYTVVGGTPYDRDKTSLAPFVLCAQCRADYEDPQHRRYHAESIACPACGPQLALHDASGKRLDEPPLAAARAALAAGRLVAVRGLGGFLLVADARHRDAIERLRALKARPHKAFAVMARELAVVEALCEVTTPSRALLTSAAAPIVIHRVRPEADAVLPIDLLTPDTRTLGVMLPSTPLHLLLAEPIGANATPPFDWLLMTSGNRRSEPICRTNEEAFERLAGIADLFVVHNREILLRADDSVCLATGETPQIVRRARGYAPNSLLARAPARRTVLALGAEVKSTLTLAFDDALVMAPHVGDLETPEAMDGLAELAERFPRFLFRTPECIAVDMHPDMHATRLGETIAKAAGLPLVRVQHHHAHAQACMAEHGLTESLALVFDGTGYGDDGSIWGAELLWVTAEGARRLGSFAPAPLPGGDAAVRDPARQLVGRFVQAGLPLSDTWRAALQTSESESAAWSMQVARNLNCAHSHAAGRVFDAFAAALGVARRPLTYEGQAAIRLEELASATREPVDDLVPFVLRPAPFGVLVDFGPAMERLRSGPPSDVSRWARGVHDSMARAALALALHGRDVSGLSTLVCTGGVMANQLFSHRLKLLLREAAFDARWPQQFPPNDGAISLGQAVVAARCDLPRRPM